MRILFALPLLMAAACEANVDKGNEAVTLEYDQNLAENTVATVTNEAQEIGGHIVNDVSETAGQVQNEVGDVDVDVDVDANASANTN